MTDASVTGQANAPAANPFVAIVGQMALGWNRADSDLYAGVFGDQVDFVDILGGHGVGRQAVKTSHEAMFQGPFAGSRIEYWIEKVKPIGQHTSVVFLRAKILTRAGEIWCRPTLTLRLADDGWRIAVFQNTRIGELAPPAGTAPAAVASQAVASSASVSADPAEDAKGERADKGTVDAKAGAWEAAAPASARENRDAGSKQKRGRPAKAKA